MAGCNVTKFAQLRQRIAEVDALCQRMDRATFPNRMEVANARHVLAQSPVVRQGDLLGTKVACGLDRQEDGNVRAD